MLIPGYSVLKLLMMLGKKLLAMDGKTAMLTCPLRRSAVARKLWMAVSKSLTSLSATGKKFSPSLVGITRLVVLSSSLSPVYSSNCLIAKVIAGWVRAKVSAARLKLPSLATTINVRKCLSEIFKCLIMHQLFQIK